MAKTVVLLACLAIVGLVQCNEDDKKNKGKVPSFADNVKTSSEFTLDAEELARRGVKDGEPVSFTIKDGKLSGEVEDHREDEEEEEEGSHSRWPLKGSGSDEEEDEDDDDDEGSMVTDSESPKDQIDQSHGEDLEDEDEDEDEDDDDEDEEEDEEDWEEQNTSMNMMKDEGKQQGTTEKA